MTAAWKTVYLGDCCSKIGSGATPRGGDSVYTEQGTAFIRSQNVYNGSFAWDGLAYLADLQAQDLNGVTVGKGDVLLNITGDSVARCCIAPSDVLPARVSQHVAIIRPRPTEFDPRFIAYYLISPHMQATMLSLAGSGGTRKALTKEMIERFAIPTPPFDIQLRIADRIAAYDDLIENNRRRIALLREATRLLYREWFAFCRFPGHATCQFVESRLGRIPREWRVVTLGEITTKIGSGATPRGGEASYESEGIALVRSMNVYDDVFEDEGLAYINESQAEELRAVALQSDDILLNITGASVARCCMVPDRHLPARVNQHVMIIRPDPAFCDACYVLASINSEQRKQQLLSFARSGGATREALTRELVSKFEIALPARPILDRFTAYAKVNAHQQSILASQNAVLRKARDLLLPRLMSGELEV